MTTTTNTSNLFASFVDLEAKNRTRSPRQSGTGVLTIINDVRKGNGHRIVFSKQIETDLGLSNEVQILASKEQRALLIGAKLPNAKHTYKLGRVSKKNPKSKFVIYNKPLVMELAETLGIDYSQGTSYTFYKVHYLEYEDSVIALIKMEGDES